MLYQDGSRFPEAGWQLDVTIFEGEGDHILEDVTTPLAQDAIGRMSAFINHHLGTPGAG